MPRPKSMVTTEMNPAPQLDVGPRSFSFEHLSLAEKGHSNGFSHLGDQSTMYLTSTEYLTATQFDSDADHTHPDIRSMDHRLVLYTVQP